jgi:hypothetical protein
MKATMLAALAALSLTTTAVPTAQAGDWTTHWAGPYGGVYEGGGRCDNGVCRSSGTFTGPYGGVWHRRGRSHWVGPGQWVGEGRIVGPGGGTWQHSWSWHR